MYQSYIPAEEILLVHDTMIREEMQRHNAHMHRFFRDAGRPRRRIALRRIAGRALIALGGRLDPASLPLDRPVPAPHA